MRLEDYLKRREKYYNMPNKRSIGGTIDKRFVRICDDKQVVKSTTSCVEKKIEDSVIFRELYESLLSGKSSYVTYLNGLFFDDKGTPLKQQDIYLPSYVSTLEKDVLDNKWLYTEVVGSRLANLMGIDTAYNTILHLSDCGDSMQTRKLLSVDFVPYGYSVISFEDMGFEQCGDYTSIGTFVNNIRKDFVAFAKKHGLKPTAYKVEKLIDNFCEQYLFKCCMCADTDFDTNNVAILYNQETGDFRLAPLFDMEGLFGMITANCQPNLAQKYMMSESIRYLVEHNANTIEDFIHRLNKLRMSKKLKTTIEDSCKDINNKTNINNWYTIVKNNSQLMCEKMLSLTNH